MPEIPEGNDLYLHALQLARFQDIFVLDLKFHFVSFHGKVERGVIILK